MPCNRSSKSKRGCCPPFAHPVLSWHQKSGPAWGSPTRCGSRGSGNRRTHRFTGNGGPARERHAARLRCYAMSDDCPMFPPDGGFLKRRATQHRVALLSSVLVSVPVHSSSGGIAIIDMEGSARSPQRRHSGSGLRSWGRKILYSTMPRIGYPKGRQAQATVLTSWTRPFVKGQHMNAVLVFQREAHRGAGHHDRAA